jgi:hypothetical protein
MYYRALYGQVAYQAALEDAVSLIARDNYFPLHPVNTEAGPSGTGLKLSITFVRRKRQWYVKLGPLAPRPQEKRLLLRKDAVTVEDVLTHTVVGWTSAKGDQIRYHFNHNDQIVEVEIQSQPGKIPSDALRSFKPQNIIAYKTRARNVGPWETQT